MSLEEDIRKLVDKYCSKEKMNIKLWNRLITNYAMYCEKCNTVTAHDRVKYMYRWYNRCRICLDEEIEKYGIYIPPFIRKGNLGKFRDDFKMLKVI